MKIPVKDREYAAFSPGAKVVVTGGAGFLGSRVSDCLLDLGCQVTSIDDFSIGSIHSKERLASPLFRSVRVDIRDRTAVMEDIRIVMPEMIFHLAALHFIPACIADPHRTMEINVIGTQNVIDACRQLEFPPRFVLASTADVYVPSDTPHSETSTIGPDNVYGLSKLVDEGLVHFAAKQGILYPTICRLFNLYGSFETNPHVIPEIVQQLRMGSTLRLGNTKPRRDFVQVDAAAKTLVTLSQMATVGSTINVGSGNSYSIDDVIDVFRRELNRHVTVEVDPQRWRPTDRPNLQADPSMLRSFIPEGIGINLVDGIRQLIREEQLIS